MSSGSIVCEKYPAAKRIPQYINLIIVSFLNLHVPINDNDPCVTFQNLALAFSESRFGVDGWWHYQIVKVIESCLRSKESVMTLIKHSMAIITAEYNMNLNQQKIEHMADKHNPAVQ